MSITTTTLSGAVAVNDLSISVASAAGAAVKNVIRIDDEWFTQSSDASGTALPVLRGQQGSYNRTHVAGAVVQMGLASDFPVAPAGTVIPVPVSPTVVHQSTPANATTPAVLTVPLSNQGVFITLLGTTTNTYTIVEPVAAQEGQIITIQAGAAHAYIVQALDSLGVASDTSFSGDQDLATFGGAIGDAFSFKAVNGAWMVLYKTNVTLSDT